MAGITFFKSSSGGSIVRVALINGICAKHDAISNAVVAEYGYLQDKFGPEGVKFYGYALDYTNWKP